MLKPCPFCGAGVTEIKETFPSGVRIDGRPREPISAEVRHWCDPVPGQPSRQHITMAGRDKAGAVEFWNRGLG